MPAKRGSRRAAKKAHVEDDSTLASATLASATQATQATQTTQDSMGLTQRSQPPVIKTLGLPFDNPEEVESWDGFAEDEDQEASAQCPICFWIFPSRPDLPAMYAAASCAQRCRPGKPPRHLKNDWNGDGCPGVDPRSWRMGSDVEVLLENKWCAARLVKRAKEGMWVASLDEDSTETEPLCTAAIRPRPESPGKSSTSGAATVDTVAAAAAGGCDIAAGGCDIDDDDGIDCDWGDANSGDSDEPAQAQTGQRWGEVAAPAAPAASSVQSAAAVAAAAPPSAPAPPQQLSEISDMSGLSGPVSQQLVEPRDQPDSLGSLASLGAGFPQGEAHDTTPTPAALPAPSDSILRATPRTRQPSGAKVTDHTVTTKPAEAEAPPAAPGNSDGTADRDTPLTQGSKQGSFAIERVASTRGAKSKPKPKPKCPSLLEKGMRRQRCDDASMRLAKRVRAALPDMSQPTQLQHRVEMDVHDELVQRCAEYDIAAMRFAKCIRATAPDIASQELHGLEDDMRSAVVQMLE